jgi:hypothetical protein
MRDYYTELDLKRIPGETAESIHKQLVALRQQCSARITHPDLNISQDAERKLALIIEANRVFSDEDSKRSYDVDLNEYKRREDVAERSGDATETDEYYKKALARINEFYDAKDYKTATDRAIKLLAESDDYKTPDVYVILMYSLYAQGSSEQDGRCDGQIQDFGDEAVDRYNIIDNRIYRVYAFATERKKNFSYAHRRLVELKNIRPNDTSVDYLIADMFMNRFGGQYLAEARDYIDALIRSKGYDSDSTVAEWDVRCELRQHRLQLAIPKIARYLTADPADAHLTAGPSADAPFRREALPHFTKLLEDYIRNSCSNIASYLAKLDSTSAADNIVCGRYIPAWDMVYTLERSNDLTADWYKLVEKYAGQKLSSTCYEVMKRHAARCVRALPTYEAAVSADASTLSTSNNADYPAVSKQLAALNTVREQAYVSDGSVDDMITEVDGAYSYGQNQSRLKPLKRVRLFTRAYWCVFLVPLLMLLDVTLEDGSQDLLQEVREPVTTAHCYLFVLSIIAAFHLIRAAFLREKKLGQKGRGSVWGMFMAGILVVPTMLYLLVSSEEKMSEIARESANTNLAIIGKLFDGCYSIVSVQPIVSGIITLTIFIVGCVVYTKIKVVTLNMDGIQFGTTLMSWIR